MKEKTEQEMLHRTAAYCSGTERCISEVKKKLAPAGLPDDAIQRIINRLLEEKFIDEERYTRYFVNDKLRFNKWGRIKINYELQKKGISGILRDQALSNIDEEEYKKTLSDLIKAKIRITRSSSPYDLRMKLLRFAAGRGFESNVSSNCIKQLIKGDDDSFDLD